VAARRFVSEVGDRMRRVRGVRDVAMMSFPPFLGSASIAEIRVPGRPAPAKPFNAFQNLVSENYFDVMRIPMRSGRSFTTRDNDGSDPVAIVNETAASRWWPGETPIGRSVVVSRGRTETSVTVVGVSRDGRLMGQDTKVRPEIYLPMSQGNPRFVTFIAHTSVDPPLLARELQRAVWSVAPRLPIETTTDLASIASESLRTTRFFSVAMSSFATVAVGLSGLGIYGLLAFAVARRRREIGIRIALGAPATAVGGSVLRRALVLGIAGVASGIVLARWLSRYLESLLLEVGATDATVFTATAIGVLFVALLAACAPVVQAVRVDPIKSLRV
jgi:predicted permease